MVAFLNIKHSEQNNNEHTQIINFEIDKIMVL